MIVVSYSLVLDHVNVIGVTRRLEKEVKKVEIVMGQRA